MRHPTSGKDEAAVQVALEESRTALLKRLHNLDGRAKDMPGYRTAMSLLNSKFRKASLGARIAVLQSATFMVEVLERLPL